MFGKEKKHILLALTRLLEEAEEWSKWYLKLPISHEVTVGNDVFILTVKETFDSFQIELLKNRRVKEEFSYSETFDRIMSYSEGEWDRTVYFHGEIKKQLLQIVEIVENKLQTQKQNKKENIVTHIEEVATHKIEGYQPVAFFKNEIPNYVISFSKDNGVKTYLKEEGDYKIILTKYHDEKILEIKYHIALTEIFSFHCHIPELYQEQKELLFSFIDKILFQPYKVIESEEDKFIKEYNEKMSS